MDHFGNQLHSTDSHGNSVGHGTAGYGDHPAGGHGADHHVEHGTGGHAPGGHDELISGLHAPGGHGEHRTGPNAVGGVVGGLGTGQHRQKVVHGEGAAGVLRRSGSSSSSSSEDDGLGGRRKKGIKEKVKEKLPGGHNKPAYETPHDHLEGAGAPQEKKGIVEKMKEKLSGNN